MRRTSPTYLNPTFLLALSTAISGNPIYTLFPREVMSISLLLDGQGINMNFTGKDLLLLFRQKALSHRWFFIPDEARNWALLLSCEKRLAELLSLRQHDWKRRIRLNETEGERLQALESIIIYTRIGRLMVHHEVSGESGIKQPHS